MTIRRRRVRPLRIGVILLSVVVIATQAAPSQADDAARSTDAVAQSTTFPDTAPVLTRIGRLMLDDAVIREKNTAAAGPSQAEPIFPLPMCGFVGGLCGALNRDGTIAVVPTFDWVDSFHEGRARVRSRGLYGYVDTFGRIIVKPQFSAAEPFSGGLAQIEVDGSAALIDRDGREVVPHALGFAARFTDDVFWVGTGQLDQSDWRKLGLSRTPKNEALLRSNFPSGKWGLIDRAGAWIRQPDLTLVKLYDHSRHDLMWAKSDKGWGLIRPDGSWQIEPQFDDVRSTESGLTPIALKHLWGFADTSVRIVIEPKFEGALPFSGQFAGVRANGKFGFVDRTGTLVVEPKYDFIWHDVRFPASWWWIKSGDKYGLIDASGHLLLPPQFDQTPTICADGRLRWQSSAAKWAC